MRQIEVSQRDKPVAMVCNLKDLESNTMRFGLLTDKRGPMRGV